MGTLGARWKASAHRDRGGLMPSSDAFNSRAAMLQLRPGSRIDRKAQRLEFRLGQVMDDGLI
ncbi:MAG: hypothetical protein KKD28_02510 [Chloroflexi bacterium]|nr:hypothetical protein [Chloroflexota bacterium]MBU1660327.1 hypothetical protein [Chloroflexota bacterium]